ncbi:MAG TPA: GNAT family N-acetyltransferase [Thermoanaerobaculia bacterium]|jgi:GNAT superfamily N-acetyltransferase|nr:GNAT family N-acetyltransferase [Thermoanaerobaculia bacterium]
MIHGGNRDDLPRIARLLADANDAPYALERVAEEKCFGAGVAGEPRVRIFGDFQGIAVTCGKALRILAVAREERGKGIGSALLEDANATLVAAEGGNYFTPGVVTADRNTIGFLERRGYRQTAQTQNLLARDLPDELPQGVKEGPVLDFIEQEFGQIWRFEAAHASKVFYVEEHGQVAGFAAHDANNRGLGFFGPTGVAKQHRGKGLGRTLLLAALADMKRQGHAEAVIPWTNALDFYRRSCGAEVQHRFVTLARYIPQP